MNKTAEAQSVLNDEACSRWVKDLVRFLPVKSQFVLSRNIRDIYPFPVGGGDYAILPLAPCLAEILKLQGYNYFLTYKPGDGLSPLTPRGEDEKSVRQYFSNTFKIGFDNRGTCPCSLEKFLGIIEQIGGENKQFIAVFADYASRYAVRVDSLQAKEHDYFTRALILSQSVAPHVDENVRIAQFNPIFWLCDKENDLPDWFILDNPRIRSIVIPKPDHVLRRALARALSPKLAGYDIIPHEERETLQQVFIDQTDGLMLTDVVAITHLCMREQLDFSQIGEAVRRYKLGVTEDPWRRIDRRKIADGEAFIRRRVKGQTQAITKALDIVKRAFTGLSSAQTLKMGGRPRGVMFLAGPTGTGKTELAKTLTELLFGDERAYIRFDMSEFATEHADQRLLGAPPGYVGYDAGGELTNAIRERPFSVVLFDEIEKSHPRILDKFLQILDDGVLTSGRGERVYFSESVVIFTSNLGIYKTGPDGIRELNVSPGDPYEEVAGKVRAEIDDFFKLHLNRPEILNRIGENIVVFDFIRKDIAAQIFDKMVENIFKRLASQQKIIVSLDDSVKQQLLELCTRNLSNGGRGIGNQLEALLINPLARALFDNSLGEGARVQVSALDQDKGVPMLLLHQETSPVAASRKS